MGHISARTVVQPGRDGQALRRIPGWALIMIILGLLAAVGFAFASSLLQVYRLKREETRLLQVKRELIEQNAQLREEIKLLHTPGYIERLAREQLGLVRPGEVAMLIVRPQGDAPAAGRPQGPNRGAQTKPSQAPRTWRTILKRLGF